MAPGLATWDFSALKDNAISQRLQLQFRAEIFNLLNRANFNTPNLIAFTPPTASNPTGLRAPGSAAAQVPQESFALWEQRLALGLWQRQADFLRQRRSNIDHIDHAEFFTGRNARSHDEERGAQRHDKRKLAVCAAGLHLGDHRTFQRMSGAPAGFQSNKKGSVGIGATIPELLRIEDAIDSAGWIIGYFR